MSSLFPTVRSQLAAGFAIIVLLLLVVVGVATYNFNRLLWNQQELFGAAFRDLVQVQELEVNSHDARLLLVMELFDRSEDDRLIRVRDEQTRLFQENDRILSELRERHPANTPMRSLLDEVYDLHRLLADTRDNEVIPAIIANELNTAFRITVGGVQEERYGRKRELIGEILGLTAERATRQVRDTESQTLAARNLLVVMGGLAVLFAVGMAVVLSKLISTPLGLLTEAAGRIAKGDLTVDVPETRRSDDLGDLSRSFRSMVRALRRVNQEIREGVNVLASTSSEILAATSQIATGVSETAASVNETTATLDEARQTANLVSEKARTVSEVSQTAARVSRNGRREVEAAIQDMDVIREHMENIGGSIARLHEHSQAIGDIILTVNDLSEQSNLLAVNAAIEAAKAGESGKGFSVVAREMKNLAVQSKQATSQVRSILGEIQQNANATVMATERGHKVVEAGVSRSRSAGDAIREITESIGEAAQAAMQIAASSNEQLIGMEQVATAMENITQASHQNAAGTKQAEESARALHDLGGRLREMVDRYKL